MFKHPVARYHEITRAWNSAVLLAQIVFWMKNPKIVHEGKPWVANSAAEWCRQTGLTCDQYRRAISRLKKPPLSLIWTEQHLFGGKNITHIFLTERGKELLAELRTGRSPKTAQSAAPEQGVGAHPEGGKSAQLITEEINKEEHKETTVAFAKAHAIPDPLFKQDQTPGEIKRNLGGSIDSSPETKTSLGDQASNSTTGLAGVWKSANEQTSGDFIPAPTVRELKMLKTFPLRCPEGKAASVIELCVKHWGDFTKKAADEEGAWSIPSKPTLEFLLKFIKTAINFALKTAEAQSESKAVKPKPKYEIICGKNPPENTKATHEEMMQILNE